MTNDTDRARLLRDLLAEPDEVAATAVERARRSRRELRHADFGDVLDVLRSESDALVRQLREALRGR